MVVLLELHSAVLLKKLFKITAYYLLKYHAYKKIIHFSFVLCIYTECGNKVACSKDVLKYHLFRTFSVSTSNENS